MDGGLGFSLALIRKRSMEIALSEGVELELEDMLDECKMVDRGRISSVFVSADMLKCCVGPTEIVGM